RASSAPIRIRRQSSARGICPMPAAPSRSSRSPPASCLPLLPRAARLPSRSDVQSFVSRVLPRGPELYDGSIRLWWRFPPAGAGPQGGMMRTSRFICVSIVIGGFLTGSQAVYAQTPPPQPGDAQALRTEIDQLKRDFDARLAALEARLTAIEGGQRAEGQPAATPTAQVPPGAAGAGGPSGTLPVYGTTGAAVSGAKVFNPDMAVIGDFLGAGGTNRTNPNPALEVHESEAAFQAIVDPYARADFFISFGQEGVNLE